MYPIIFVEVFLYCSESFTADIESIFYSVILRLLSRINK